MNNVTTDRTAHAGRPSRLNGRRIVLLAIATCVLAVGCITPTDPRLDDSSRVEAPVRAAVAATNAN
jgi:hypothetical protein